MRNSTNKFLDTLKCPICKSPIDAIDNSSGIRNVCAVNDNHYRVFLIFNRVSEPSLLKEVTNLYDKGVCYKITKDYSRLYLNVLEDSRVFYLIEIFDTDLEGRIIFSHKRRELTVDDDICLFDFSNFDIKNALTRVKTLFLLD